MLLVLSSISSHTNTLSLTSRAAPHESPGERAVANLLRLVLYPQGQHAGTGPGGLGLGGLGLGLAGGVPGGKGDHTITHLPSFLSGGAPRDRRGRVARKSLHVKVQQLLEGGSGRGGAMAEDAKWERDRELLEQLKSPDVPETPANIPGIIVNNASGWGAHAPGESRPIVGFVVDDHEDELHGADGGLGSLRAAMALGGGEATSAPNWQPSEERMDNWDEAQEVVERMVGMKGENLPATPSEATVRQGR